MKAQMLARLIAVAGLALSTSGCSTMAADTVLATTDSMHGLISSSGLKAHAVRSIKTITINRVAVMPLVEAAQTGDPLAPGAADTVSAELYSEVAVAGGWDTVPQQDIDDAMQQLPPLTPTNLDEEALKLGHDVSADGVLYGTVERYHERVGMDYSASSPAAVTFVLKFVDLKTRQIVWTAKFAKSQAALTENIFEFANFVQRSGKWVRAHEIALEGVRESVADLHGDLTLLPNIKRFETKTYEQLKAGARPASKNDNAGN